MPTAEILVAFPVFSNRIYREDLTTKCLCVDKEHLTIESGRSCRDSGRSVAIG